MGLVRIEAGSFEMGELKRPLAKGVASHAFLAAGDPDERPIRRVTISAPFSIGRFEVTNAQYELYDPTHRALRGKHAARDGRAGLSSADDEAVIDVSWYEANAFCRWLSDKEGRPYRLPTEAEWEYACRAGTTTHYSTGDTLPTPYHKAAVRTGGPVLVSLRVGETPPNAWGLHDMHGNVEEWCLDGYGPYPDRAQVDPIGYAPADFRVTRGGSFGTPVYYLRSANRMGALPESRNWRTGFRVVLGESPVGKTLKAPPPPLHRQNVLERDSNEVARGPDPKKPYFRGPRKYVRIPPEANGPVFASHNHSPTIVACPNGDLLAAWFSTVTEGNREMALAGTRLRRGQEEWDLATPFWDAPDRNDTTPMLFRGKDGTLFHFTNIAAAATSTSILAVRSSEDSGASWSSARVLISNFVKGQILANLPMQLEDGGVVLPFDSSGTLRVSRDGGLTWKLLTGRLRGIHFPIVELADRRWIAFSRRGDIDGRSARNESNDGGATFSYRASEFPSIGGGQRAAMLRLQEGPLFFASFADQGISIRDSSGEERTVRGLFAAVSDDLAATWRLKKLVSDDGPGRAVESTNGGLFTLSARNGEYQGYMSACQSSDGVIHLITSRQHYAFNLKWLQTLPPVPAPPLAARALTETFDGNDFDAPGWVAYRGFTGGFNGVGQYTLTSSYGGAGFNRIVGGGSFEVTARFVHPKLGPSDGPHPSNIELRFRDVRLRDLSIKAGRQGISVRWKDKGTTYPAPSSSGAADAISEVAFETIPDSIVFRVVHLESERRWRIFYGLGGEGATEELPRSRAGIRFSEPFGESTAAYLLVDQGTVGLDHFEVRPH